MSPWQVFGTCPHQSVALCLLETGSDPFFKNTIFCFIIKGTRDCLQVGGKCKEKSNILFNDSILLILRGKRGHGLGVGCVLSHACCDFVSEPLPTPCGRPDSEGDSPPGRSGTCWGHRWVPACGPSARLPFSPRCALGSRPVPGMGLRPQGQLSGGKDSLSSCIFLKRGFPGAFSSCLYI